MDRSVRIAIADDEPVMQMYLEETLRALGHDVVLVAGNGRELIDLWPEHPADLVITDIKMPELDGLAAAREIYRRRVVPVVFITGYNRLEDVAREDIDLVHVYLVKPVGMEELRHAVDAALCLFDEFRIVLDEDGDPARALREFRLVERARRILADRVGEGDAFARLRALAEADNQTLVAAARQFLAQSTSESE